MTPPDFEQPDRREIKLKIAASFNVPPWLADPEFLMPRFPRLRWALRHIWRFR